MTPLRTLPLSVAPIDGETTDGYLRRLAVVNYTTVAEVRQLMTGCQLAQQNIDLTVVPEIAARSCPLPGLAVIPLRDGLPPRKLGVVTSEFHQPSQFENAVLSQLR